MYAKNMGSVPSYLPFAQVASLFPFFQWRKRLYCKNSPKEMTEDKIGDILGL